MTGVRRATEFAGKPLWRNSLVNRKAKTAEGAGMKMVGKSELFRNGFSFFPPIFCVRKILEQEQAML
jgi:hypothetical protein